jgi:hypothetical protein
MNAIRMPGFTADASLFAPSVNYRLDRSYVEPFSLGVEPQLQPNNPREPANQLDVPGPGECVQGVCVDGYCNYTLCNGYGGSYDNGGLSRGEIQCRRKCYSTSHNKAVLTRCLGEC